MSRNIISFKDYIENKINEDFGIGSQQYGMNISGGFGTSEINILQKINIQ